MNVKLRAIFFGVILCLFVDIKGEVLKQEPIVIKTPVGNYGQPSFDDYKSCVKALDSCTTLCDGSEECLSKCKKCPLLIQQDILVQGVNDTDYHTSSNVSVNSTNVIRVTNEIHNVIENNLGGIQTKNENNINIYTKNNSTCDKFGLGCNENGTCCYIVRNYQREKHCGKRCQARVMLEKTVVQCNDETNPDSCKKIVEYKPLRTKRMKHVSDNFRCRYDSHWPFVNCPNRREINERCPSICLSLSYLYILQHGIPPHCINCFKSFGDSTKASIHPLVEDDHTSFDSHDKEWILEVTKCRLKNGTISKNCGTNNHHVVKGNNEFGRGDDNHEFVGPALESFNALGASRKRRNLFHRSKYSLRHKQYQ